MPLSKAEVDHHFTKELMPKLPNIIRGISHKHKRVTDIDMAIAEAYLHLNRFLDTIQTTDQLDRLVINWIKQNIIWTRSQLNKQQVVRSQVLAHWEDFCEKPENENDEEHLYETSARYEHPDDDSELEDKIELELWYNERKAQLALYRAMEQDKIMQIIFDCYFNKGLTVGTDLARHLGIGRDTGARYIRELKAAIRAFAEANANN